MSVDIDCQNIGCQNIFYFTHFVEVWLQTIFQRGWIVSFQLAMMVKDQVYHYWNIAMTQQNPDSKVHGANMGPIWGRQDPDGPHVGPMNFAIWEINFYICTGATNKRTYLLKCIQNFNHELKRTSDMYLTSCSFRISPCNRYIYIIHTTCPFTHESCYNNAWVANTNTVTQNTR